jgi:hypothetical protein
MQIQCASFCSSARDFLVSDDKFPTCSPTHYLTAISFHVYEQLLISVQKQNIAFPYGILIIKYIIKYLLHVHVQRYKYKVL